MMFGSDGDIALARILGNLDPLFGIKLRGVEAILKPLVFADRDLFQEHRPLASP